MSRAEKEEDLYSTSASRSISRALRICLDHITAHQCTDGSFTSLSSDSIGMDGVRKRRHTNFHSAFIAIALSGIDCDGARVIGRKIAHFLCSTQSTQGTWNYWHPSSNENISSPYPDDLDDTASAFSAIFLFTPEAFSGTDYAKFVKELCRQEMNIGGPYKTWCVNENKTYEENEVDVGVNAAIGYSLSLHDIALKGLDSYIEKAIKENRLTSKYYQDDISLIYLISRWYQGEKRLSLIEKLHSKLRDDAVCREPLLLSMVITSLIRLGESVESLEPYTDILCLLSLRGPKAYGLYIEKIEAEKTWYSGSGTLTAALCAEALSLFSNKKITFSNSINLLTEFELEFQN